MLIMSLEKEREMGRAMRVWWTRLLYSVNSSVGKDSRYATRVRDLRNIKLLY